MQHIFVNGIIDEKFLTNNYTLISRVHNIKREESVLLQYSLYKRESQSYDAILIVTFNVLVCQVSTLH